MQGSALFMYILILIRTRRVRQDSSKLLVSTGKLLQIKDQPSADKWQIYRKITEQDPLPTTIPRDKTLKNLIRYVGIPQDMREKVIVTGYQVGTFVLRICRSVFLALLAFWIAIQALLGSS